MTISRIFPSNEINVPKAAKSVAHLIGDRKRRVRQAALELIASLAQLSATGLILDIVSNVMEGYPEKEQLMQVLRTRYY